MPELAVGKLECRVDESWSGGGICLGMYAETIEYKRYMQRTVPKHPRQGRRMAYEVTSYRDDDDDADDDDDDDDDKDDEQPRCRPLRVLQDEADADDDDDDEMMLTHGHPRGIRTP